MRQVEAWLSSLAMDLRPRVAMACPVSAVRLPAPIALAWPLVGSAAPAQLVARRQPVRIVLPMVRPAVVQAPETGLGARQADLLPVQVAVSERPIVVFHRTPPGWPPAASQPIRP